MKYSSFFIILFSIVSQGQMHKKNQMDSIPYWQYSQFGKDSLSGINCDNLQLPLSDDKNKVIIAWIDSDIDINHEYLSEFIWSNNNEIAKNKQDDDGNGYIDDINGWNYLAQGNEKIVKYANNTSLRFTKTFENKFKKLNKDGKHLTPDEQDFIKIYNNALKATQEEKEALTSYESYVKWYSESNLSSDSLLRTYNLKKPYNLDKLDSLFNKVYTVEKDEQRGRLIYFALDNLQNNRAIDYKTSLEHLRNNNDYALNQSLIEKPRKKLTKSLQYGSNQLDINIENEEHGTQIGGAIIKTFKYINNNPTTNKNIEIMPISIFPEIGAEFETDLASAIRYATDNGADIINYSSTLRFLLDPNIVYEALRYAEQNNVLFVTSAGNTSLDLDNIITHPRKKYKNYDLSNLIMVGSSDSIIGTKLKPNFGSYGKNTVDLFAPGTDFLTTLPKNEYGKTSGSSISSAIVASTAACIKLYYPKLSAREIRKIILDSVSIYNGEIFLNEDGTEKISFSELSSSGGVLNVKKAFELAAEIEISK